MQIQTTKVYNKFPYLQTLSFRLLINNSLKSQIALYLVDIFIKRKYKLAHIRPRILLQNKNIQFEEVNVTEYSRQIEFKVHDLQNKEIPHVIKSLGEMPPELTLDALQKMKKNIPHLTIENLINDWEKWSQTKDVLRVLLNGEIVAVSEDYYDMSILEKTQKEYQNASRVVGDVMGKSEQCIGDTYLAFRVYQLIQQGKLNYKGALDFLSKFEIRLP